MPEKFNPKSCPVGIANSKEIEKVGEVFSMDIERIDKNLAELSRTMTEIAQSQIVTAEKTKSLCESQAEANRRFEAFQAEFDKKVDARIAEKIDKSLKDKVFNIARWVFLAVGGVGVSILTAAALRALNLA